LYARHGFQLLITWYTFFIAGNLIAFGWFITRANESGNLNIVYVALVSAIFLLVNALGIAACRLAGQYFLRAARRLEEIVADEGNVDSHAGELSPQSPLPITPYKTAVLLMQLSLWGLLLMWVAFSVVVGLLPPATDIPDKAGIVSGGL